jgi:hypothetical protein
MTLQNMVHIFTTRLKKAKCRCTVNLNNFERTASTVNTVIGYPGSSVT